MIPLAISGSRSGSDYKLSAGLRVELGIMVHRNTSVYINMTQDERSLGRNIYTYARCTILTISQITLEYMTGHPHPSSVHEELIPMTDDCPSRAVLCRPHRRHRAGVRAVGAAPAALGLLVAANRPLAGPPSHGHPGPLERGPAIRGPIASRSGRRHRQDLGEPQIQRPGGAALVRQGARRAAAGDAAIGGVGDVSRQDR